MEKLVTISMLLVIGFILPLESYRILGVFPFHSRSHQMLFDGIAKGLARKGHQVDFITFNPMKKPVPNYKVVVNLQNMTESLVNKWDVTFANQLGSDTLPTAATICGNYLCEYLAMPEMQEFIKNPPKDPPYDLVIVEIK
ncbi:hypothetical protein PV327_008909 [Microctonus hyperodae]|uniref:Glucuronosyltransferase n=1 Tax=Microctonus hyperodae TaxID=165561 RepID=A0AA39FTD6_MICHY|nr:hypothetical protein PV327_008909 [Microctonus hyperodae]